MAITLCVAGSLSGATVWGQQQPPAYVGFEGRKVSRVDLSASTRADVEVFRPLVKQKADKPFSTAAIRASVTALEQTRLFSAVQVSVTPEPSGLKVVFVLEPAYYVGLISFPGAAGKFAYTRLLQAVNIPPQTPFTNDLSAQGQTALLHFFQTNGYFAASVRPEVRKDAAHRIANLVFACDLNHVAKIGDIDIEGAPAKQTAELRSVLGSFWARLKHSSLKSGQKYSERKINKAIDRMTAHLRSQNRLAGSVRFASASYNRRSNRAALTFDVSEGPLVTIRVEGAHLWQRTKNRLIPIYQENAIDLDLVNEGGSNLVNYFQSKGYFDAKVDAQTTKQPGHTTIVYVVHKGARHRVTDVAFHGNRYFSDSQLQADASVEKGRFVLSHAFSHGRFSNDLLRKSVNSLKAVYQNAGFAYVSVESKVVDREPKVDVIFQIYEGPQDKVASLRIVGNSTQSVQALTAGRALNLAPGQPYSRHRLEADRNDILAHYFDRGYLNARFDSSVASVPGDPHRMDVTYTIQEGPQDRISEVILLGQEHTRTDFIRAVTGADLSAGKPLSQGKFYAGEDSLYNLGIFDWVSIQPLRPISNQLEEELPIKVHESKRNTVEFGGGIEVIPRSGNIPVGTVALPGLPQIGLGSKFSITQKSFIGPRFSFEFDRRNMRGKAETTSFATILSRLTQSGSITYSDPHFRGWNWSSLLSLSGERTTENPIYTAELGQASFQIQRSLDARRTKSLIFRYSFQRTTLGNILIPGLVLPEDQKIRTSTFAAEYVRDSRDKPLDAHHGVFQTFDLGITPSALGSSADFVRFLGQSAFYIPARPWLTWANNLRLGLATPFAGSAVPLSERFFSGGADSLRGFPINGAGPQRPVRACSNPADSSTCTLISVPVGGDMLFILNSEARFPLPITHGLGGVVFYDGGNVYRNINLHQLVSDYTNTVGFGIRYQTPVGPIRFDVGYRLTSIPGVKALQYFVTLGQAF